MASFVTKSVRSRTAAQPRSQGGVPAKGYDAKGRRVWTAEERKVFAEMAKRTPVYGASSATRG